MEGTGPTLQLSTVPNSWRLWKWRSQRPEARVGRGEQRHEDKEGKEPLGVPEVLVIPWVRLLVTCTCVIGPGKAGSLTGRCPLLGCGKKSGLQHSGDWWHTPPQSGSLSSNPPGSASPGHTLAVSWSSSGCGPEVPPRSSQGLPTQLLLLTTQTQELAAPHRSGGELPRARKGFVGSRRWC